MTRQLQRGEYIAHYRIERHLASGFEGDCYLARDMYATGLCTVKLMRGRDHIADAEHTARHYARLAGFSCVKRFREWGILSGQRSVGERAWLSFDYIPGQTLAHRLATGRSGEPMVTLWKVCEALLPLHREGLAIGDFDFERNVLIETGTGLVKFCDLDSGSPDRRPPKPREDMHELQRVARRLWRAKGLPCPKGMLAQLAAAPDLTRLMQRLPPIPGCQAT